MDLKLVTNYKLTGDQPQAVEKLVSNLKKNQRYQTLLGVTGSGKTFSVANVIEKTQKPTLVISHNKTLAAQLYQEFRDFFPQNAVSYFVSYYDYYQPEAYIPSTDTYIEKDSDVNELIDKLRLAATTNILTRKDVIVVASVSCIYNLGSPKEYGNFVLELTPGMKIQRVQILDRLASLQYERSDFGFHRGTFRVRGDIIDVYPAYDDVGVKIQLSGDYLARIDKFDPVSGQTLEENLNFFILYPSKHYVTDPNKNKSVFKQIQDDLKFQVEKFKDEGKLLEANRISQKVTYDLEMIQELGYTKGIENYSRYFDGRAEGEPPFTLVDYFNEAYGKDWLLVVDESHITFPQVRGMYAGDRSRKETLINYGFRLPSALDNRPLKFEEFMRLVPNFVAVSATPSEWEISMSEGNIVEQLVRPTGIVDPLVDIRPTQTQVKDVIEEVKLRANKKERVLITTLTKKTAEDVSNFLAEQGLNVQYLHSDVKTLERTDILDKLRLGKYDCLVGVNLLREGLDLPEVSLVAILDADKEGFLRSDVSLIQTMGRAARHIEGKVILYADQVTGSMDRALKEVKRRREYQVSWNKKYRITPKSIQKPVRQKLIDFEAIYEEKAKSKSRVTFSSLNDIDIDSFTPMQKKKLVINLKREMRLAANDLDFELAAGIRDKIREIEI
ncbi:excinuclease ABC subunit UvrB [Candidatus Woesebacteria bacterium]|nr:excinuclease ABC subunit UvrB [Candidatus Woesebacteria bacterium]QQG47177.1 MAG: excinuclease ABC subunit UvrB [Candidatus Woesebacteria bacterium]